MFFLIALLTALLIVINLPSKNKAKSRSWKESFTYDVLEDIKI